MEIEKALDKVTHTNWQDYEQAHIVPHIQQMLEDLRYHDHKEEVTEEDVRNFFIYEDTRQVAIKMIFE